MKDEKPSKKSFNQNQHITTQCNEFWTTGVVQNKYLLSKSTTPFSQEGHKWALAQTHSLCCSELHARCPLFALLQELCCSNHSNKNMHLKY